MNARQKAKKYKRMYEQLLNQPVKFQEIQHKIDTMRVERFYPEALVLHENSSYIREIIAKDIAQCLAIHLDEYIDYHTEFCTNVNQYCFIGEIKVVNRL